MAKYKYSRRFDERPNYVTDNLTARKLATLIKNADNGVVSDLLELNSEMESKDAHLQGVSQTRRRAITALDWEIIPDPLAENVEQAQDFSDFIFSNFRGIDSFENTLEHLQTAIGPNIAVIEKVFREGILTSTIDIPGHRLMSNPSVDNKFRILTDDNIVKGADMPEDQFVIFHPNSNAGFPLRTSITRAQAWCFLVKHYVTADWAAFSEIFGSPIRVGIVKDGATTDETNNLQDHLRQLAPDAWVMFSDAVDIKFLQANTGNQPYKEFLEWIERKQSVLYLGQTLTTEVGPTGSFAAAKVHENVRTDLLISDLKKEERMIRNDFIRQMIALRFPNVKNPPIPFFKRILFESVKIEEERLIMDKVRLGKELGLTIDTDKVAQMLNIPIIKTDEPIRE